MATALTQLRTRIQHSVPRCPAPLIDQEIIDVCRAFCEKTRIWQEERCAMALYTLTLDDDIDGEIYRVQLVKINETPETLNSVGSEVDPTTYTIQHTDDGIILTFSSAPGRTIDGGLTAEVSVRPKLTSTEIPDVIFNDYYRGLAGGVLANLFAQPEKRWSARIGHIHVQQWEYDQAVRRAMEFVATMHTSRELVMERSDRGSFQII